MPPIADLTKRCGPYIEGSNDFPALVTYLSPTTESLIAFRAEDNCPNGNVRDPTFAQFYFNSAAYRGYYEKTPLNSGRCLNPGDISPTLTLRCLFGSIVDAQLAGDGCSFALVDPAAYTFV